MAFRLLENKGKLPESDLVGYIRGFLFSLALGPFAMGFFVGLVINKVVKWLSS
jgi:hypothetical protein